MCVRVSKSVCGCSRMVGGYVGGTEEGMVWGRQADGGLDDNDVEMREGAAENLGGVVLQAASVAGVGDGAVSIAICVEFETLYEAGARRPIFNFLECPIDA